MEVENYFPARKFFFPSSYIWKTRRRWDNIMLRYQARTLARREIKNLSETQSSGFALAGGSVVAQSSTGTT